MKALTYSFIFQAFLLNSCAFFTDLKDPLKKNILTKHLYFEKLWISGTLDDHYLGGRFNHSSSPVITKDLVIQGNSVNGVIAFDKRTGVKKWNLKIKNGVEVNLYKNKEHLFFGGNDGYFYSLGFKNGKVRWKKYLKSENFGAALVHENSVYFVAGEDILYALDEKTGKKIWAYKNSMNSSPLSSFSIRGNAKPLMANGLLYVGFKTGHLIALDPKTGHSVWSKKLSIYKKKEFEDIDSEPVIQRNSLYVSSYSGDLYCLEAKTGKTIWTVNEGSSSGVTLSSGDLLYYSTSSGKVLAIEKNSGKIIWTFKAINGVSTQPLLFKGLLFFGESNGSLKVLDAKNGQIVQKFEPGLGLTATPTIDVTNETLYFISNDANLFSLKIQWKTKKTSYLEKVF